LREAVEHGLECPLEIPQASYFLSKIELVATDAPGMSQWRKRLFLATTALAADPVEYFALPRDQTVIMGSQLEL
jgi:KUP system potassium uptake protein